MSNLHALTIPGGLPAGTGLRGGVSLYFPTSWRPAFSILCRGRQGSSPSRGCRPHGAGAIEAGIVHVIRFFWGVGGRACALRKPTPRERCVLTSELLFHGGHRATHLRKERDKHALRTLSEIKNLTGLPGLRSETHWRIKCFLLCLEEQHPFFEKSWTCSHPPQPWMRGQDRDGPITVSHSSDLNDWSRFGHVTQTSQSESFSGIFPPKAYWGKTPLSFVVAEPDSHHTQKTHLQQEKMKPLRRVNQRQETERASDTETQTVEPLLVETLDLAAVAMPVLSPMWFTHSFTHLYSLSPAPPFFLCVCVEEFELSFYHFQLEMP